VSTCACLLHRSHFLTLPHHRFLSPFFPSTYKSLFPQLLSFLIYTKPRGVAYPPAAPEPCVGGSIFRFPPCFQLLADSLSQLQNSTGFFSSKCKLFLQNTGGGSLFRLSSFDSRFSSFDVQTFRPSDVPTLDFTLSESSIPLPSFRFLPTGNYGPFLIRKFALFDSYMAGGMFLT
jgi:hypothetical protein